MNIRPIVMMHSPLIILYYPLIFFKILIAIYITTRGTIIPYWYDSSIFYYYTANFLRYAM